jgi:hypothetical protein
MRVIIITLRMILMTIIIINRAMATVMVTVTVITRQIPMTIIITIIPITVMMTIMGTRTHNKKLRLFLRIIN